MTWYRDALLTVIVAMLLLLAWRDLRTTVPAFQIPEYQIAAEAGHAWRLNVATGELHVCAAVAGDPKQAGGRLYCVKAGIEAERQQRKP